MKIETYIDTISGEKLEKQTNYYDNGKILNERYYLNDKVYRIDGPSVIWYYSSNGRVSAEHYYLNGKRHREDGPAIISYDKNGEITREKFFINGIEEITDPLQIKEINSKTTQKKSIQEESKNIVKPKSRKIFIIEDF